MCCLWKWKFNEINLPRIEKTGDSLMRRFATALLFMWPALTLADTPKELLEKAQVASKKNDLKEARRLVEQALEGAPKMDDAYLLRASINLREGKLEPALADCNRVLQLDPKAVDVYE